MAAGLGFFVDFIVVVNVVWFLILETFTSSDLADSRGEGKNEGSQPTASSEFLASDWDSMLRGTQASWN